MKLILIVFYTDKEEILHEILDKTDIQGFTTWGPVYGKGRQSDPRMGNQIWPGENQMLIVAVPDSKAEGLKEALVPLAVKEGGKGIKIFELSVIEWI